MKLSKKLTAIASALSVALLTTFIPVSRAATSDAIINIGSLYEPQNLSSVNS